MIIALDKRGYFLFFHEIFVVGIKALLLSTLGVVGWCKGVVYLTSPGRPTDIGLQLGKACYPCSR